MPLQQVLGISAHDLIDRIEQSLEIALLNKRCPQIGHDDISHEHYFFVRKVNQHGIMRFTASNWDQLELRSADIQVGRFVDRDVWFVAPDILGLESLAEELLPENIRAVEFPCELLLIVGPSVKLGMRA